MAIWQKKVLLSNFTNFIFSFFHLINTKANKWVAEFMSKKQTKCNSLWEKDHSWLQKCKNDQFSAYCKICKKSFSVSGGGICLVKQHDNTKTHIGRTEELCNQLTFPKGSGIQLDKSIQFYDEEKTTRAEILQALKCVDAEFLPTTSTLKRIVKNRSIQKNCRIDSSVYIIRWLYCKWFWTLSH